MRKPSVGRTKVRRYNSDRGVARCRASGLQVLDEPGALGGSVIQHLVSNENLMLQAKMLDRR